MTRHAGMWPGGKTLFALPPRPLRVIPPPPPRSPPPPRCRRSGQGSKVMHCGVITEVWLFVFSASLGPHQVPGGRGDTGVYEKEQA